MDLTQVLYYAREADRLAALWADAQQHLVIRVHRDQFLSSRAFGMDDCALYLILAYIVHQGFKLSMAFPALKAYYSRCRQHHEVIKACPENRRNLARAYLRYKRQFSKIKEANVYNEEVTSLG